MSEIIKLRTGLHSSTKLIETKRSEQTWREEGEKGGLRMLSSWCWRLYNALPSFFIPLLSEQMYSSYARHLKIKSLVAGEGKVGKLRGVSIDTVTLNHSSWMHSSSTYI